MTNWKVAACTLGAVAGLAVLVWLAWPSQTPDAAAPTRQYLDASACLLTGAQGVAGDPQAAAWQGMENTSLATRVRVQYLAVRGPATAANARPYLASLLQRHCDVVLAVGPAQVAAVAAEAARFRSVRFITVGDTKHAPAATLTTVPASPAGEVRAAVSGAVAAALSQEGL
ncbi:MAG TPA: hypothetical protein VGS19_01820 [Streptosporangiaceae bacterium]|nr:hypothetical protein [Streptosporangiaceae bacterium]